MAFDQNTRNRLQRFVSDARTLLTEEFTRQLQHEYGMNPDTGEVTELAALTHLDDTRRETWRLLFDTLSHYLATSPSGGQKEVLARVVREQAFTVLNRLAALRMMEARGFLIESVSKGYQSRGFQLYQRLAGSALGETGDAYRCYLFSLFDEFALDLAVLFDRFSPQGRLFPRESALLELLSLINHPEIEPLWAEDETIGWIYQYFNTQDERRQMRAESAAPRNSRELAVRNQFFTPRYVVEFLTDNTLGRIWYEMTQGNTALQDQCRYQVRRPSEIFLRPDEEVPELIESQEELNPEERLQQPVYIPFRPLKDPRDITILDPACGSMHFGLYAFDLYEKIYDEAWELERQVGAATFARSEELKPLSDTYETKDKFLRDVPRLIIEHNIHGIDIDPRAVQISGLSLWLRAQKSWQVQGLKPQQRPQIRRSNIVCAEPMPGEKELLEEFAAILQPRVLGQLVEHLFDQMQLAGEAGSLLKIEEEIQEAIEQAREAFSRELLRRKEVQGYLIPEVAPEWEPTLFDFADLPERTHFWSRAEQEILAALKVYSEQAEGTQATHKRLFAQDTEKGFAFIDICRQRYDAFVMNPPFGEAAVNTKTYLEEHYLDTKNDVLQAFVERGFDLLVPGGLMGAITSRAPFFLSSAQAWRERLVLRQFRPQVLADFGIGVLEAMVETAAYVLRSINETERQHLTLSILPELLQVEVNKQGNFSIPKYMNARLEPLKRHQAEQELHTLIAHRFIAEDQTISHRSFYRDERVIRQALDKSQPELPRYANLICVRLLGEEDKGGKLLASLQDSNDPRRFEVNAICFADVPGAPFAYWVDDRVRASFKMLPPFEGNGRTAKQGLATAADFRFLRLYWEVPLNEICPPEVHPITWYGPYCVPRYRWFPFAKGGAYSPYYADLHLVVNWYQHGRELEAFQGSYIRNPDYYFYPGLTWPLRTQLGFNMRAYPAGAIFGHKGPVAFVPKEDLSAYLALTNSRTFSTVTSLHMAFGSYEVGVVQRSPVPDCTGMDEEQLGKLARSTIAIKQSLDSGDETSHIFVLPTLLQVPGNLLEERTKSWAERVTETQGQLIELKRQTDAIAYQLYGITEESQQDMQVSLEEEDTTEDGEEDVDFSEVGNASAADIYRLTIDLLSYALGVALGRWDVCYVARQHPYPEPPDPFAPLPVCPPGMLSSTKGLPIESAVVTGDYPIRISGSGILVDDEGHFEDVTGRVHEVFEVIWPEDTSTIELETCGILNVKSVRECFAKPSHFFAEHLKRYSKSRRQAPIYWPLQTPSGSYTLWLYYHRLNDQTLYICVNDFVEPKIKEVIEQCNDLRVKTNRSTQDEIELERLLDFEQELKDFRDELLRVARFWKPNLNDGVQITAAPLWKLFQYKPWQKKLKDTWDKLEKGDYDWAHLSYSIWPDRVRETCKHDKSLAIAHGLEDLYEEPPEPPRKKRGRKQREMG